MEQILTKYLITLWKKVLPETLTGVQLVKKFPAFYGTRKFITAFISARHLYISQATPIQPMQPYPTSWSSILILRSHLRLGLPSDLFPSTLPTKVLYAPLVLPYTRTHLILCDLISRIASVDECRSLFYVHQHTSFTSNSCCIGLIPKSLHKPQIKIVPCKPQASL